jgi:hypothetical protein
MLPPCYCAWAAPANNATPNAALRKIRAKWQECDIAFISLIPPGFFRPF